MIIPSISFADSNTQTTNTLVSNSNMTTFISSSGYIAARPKIYGSNIVWEEYNNGGGINLKTLNLNTGETTLISSSFGSYPSIYGDKIVYQDSDESLSGLFLYDLSTKTKKQISTVGGSAIIDEDKILYTSAEEYDAAGYWKQYINIYDIRSGKTTQIKPNPNGHWYMNLAMFGDIIVYEDWRNNTSDIFMYNLITKKETQISKTGFNVNPSIYGNKIAWSFSINGNGSGKAVIAVYNINTGETTYIDHNSYSIEPTIYKDKILWNDDGHKLFMYNLSTGEETLIPTPTNFVSNNHSIYEDKIVYVSDDGTGRQSVYMYQFSTDNVPPTTAATFSSIPNSNGWYNSDVSISLTATDNQGGSGVKNISYSLNGAPPVVVDGNSISVTLNKEGTNSLTYFATDNEGNKETVKTETINIDKTAPTLEISVDKTKLWPATHKMVPVTASINASDATSGFNSVSLTSITSNEILQSDDIRSVDYNTPITDSTTLFELRAERFGKGGARVYTITFTASDKAGNVITKSVIISVPHDQSEK